MAQMTARIVLKHGMTKAQVLQELDRIHVPDTAHISVHHYEYEYDPSYTELIWTWQV